MTTDPRVFQYYQCPICKENWAWLGDHGTCIELYGACIHCSVESIDDADLMLIRARREEKERETNRRVFPCPGCGGAGCGRCQQHGWIVGYPPGYRSADLTNPTN